MTTTKERTQTRLNGAITALITAATLVIECRDSVPEGSQELVTALRDEIGDLVRDVETLRQMALGKG